MQLFCRLSYLLGMLLVPAISAFAVGLSLYVQGMASPFVGIFIGITGLFFAIKIGVWLLHAADDALELLRKQNLRTRISQVSTRLAKIPDRGIASPELSNA